MAAEEKNKDVKEILNEILVQQGYSIKSRKGLGKLGPDIKAEKDGKVWYIETVESETPGSAEFQEFYSAFFQAISRLNNKDCYHIVIAMSFKSKKSLYIRGKIYKNAWKRLGKIFPELEIWLVDASEKKFHKTEWLSWLKKQ